MKNLTLKCLIALACLAGAQVALANFADVPAYQPTWRGLAGTTLEKWAFTSTPTNGSGEGDYFGPEVTLPTVVTNTNGTATASILAEQTGVGWVLGNPGSIAKFSTTNFGWWDLGADGGGHISLTIPVSAGPGGSTRLISIQVTEAINPGLYEPATVDVTGGIQVGSTQITTVETYSPNGHFANDVKVYQSLWQVPGSGSSHAITITGATTGGRDSIIGGVVVDTSGHPPIANNATFIRATNLSWKISVANLLTNVTIPDAGDTISLLSVTGTVHGTVGTIAGGTYVGYTPVPLNQTLPDSFTYTVKDNQNGLQASAVITLNIVPQQSGQALQITNDGGQITITFAGIPGFTYDVQRSTNIGFSSFTVPLVTNAPPEGVFIYVDPAPPFPTAYYRLKQH